MQNRLFTAALGLAALLASSGLGAKEVDSWGVEPFDSGDGCYAARFVDKDVMVGFHLVPSSREFRVVASSPDWDALVAGGDQQGPVEIKLVTPAGSRTISTDEGHALQLSGGQEAIAAIWIGDGGVLARDTLSKASAMTMSFKGKTVGTFPLQNTSSALSALMRCASGLGGT